MSITQSRIVFAFADFCLGRGFILLKPIIRERRIQHIDVILCRYKLQLFPEKFVN